MKTIFRTFIFSATATYLTSLWNGGFNIGTDILTLIKFSAVFTFVFLIINPLLKLLLLPINFLTFGLLGSIINLLLFYIIFSFFPQIKIGPWDFGGLNLGFIFIPAFHLNAWVNFIVVILSISFLISLIDSLL